MDDSGNQDLFGQDLVNDAVAVHHYFTNIFVIELRYLSSTPGKLRQGPDPINDIPDNNRRVCGGIICDKVSDCF
jgi:hypothetical protein